ncbi:hypothetical protein DSAG12_00310 [Promethearchaeum syntrophicum]|uniref:Uncharacterized protein n=1 Tax=Promethearchaeum syntrophicum TaxID=2594042 RepID=A0A5B9D6S4_9ARCH|nr:hypothetical protein [Candidatus Prometheoarchaeum syntrophicum]QEE14497.1 hypothetical protein DSAG12_00310 [Candidatus Prometheoarchaeum syntrophicum]
MNHDQENRIFFESSISMGVFLTSVQILVVGRSHAHILKVLKLKHPDKVILIVSKKLKDQNEELYLNLKKKQNNLEIIHVNPFHRDFLPQMITHYIHIYQKLKVVNPSAEVQIGLTGGTNLMAIAAGISAMLLGIEAHYFVKGKVKPLIWNLKNDLADFILSNSSNFYFLQTEDNTRDKNKMSKLNSEYSSEGKEKSLLNFQEEKRGRTI